MKIDKKDRVYYLFASVLLTVLALLFIAEFYSSQEREIDNLSYAYMDSCKEAYKNDIFDSLLKKAIEDNKIVNKEYRELRRECKKSLKEDNDKKNSISKKNLLYKEKLISTQKKD